MKNIIVRTLLIISQILSPNLVWAAATEQIPGAEAGSSLETDEFDSAADSTPPSSCEYLLSSLQDTNLSDEQKRLIVEYLKNPANYEISRAQKLVALLRADTLAPGVIFRVLYRNLKHKESGKIKKQTVVIMGQTSSQRKKQAESAISIMDAIGNAAVSGESDEVRSDRERESLNSKESKFLTLVRMHIASYIANKYRSLRVFPVRLWTVIRGRKKPLQHIIREDKDLRKSVFYLEDGYVPKVEEGADVFGGDVRTSLYLSTMYMFVMEINSYLMKGSDYFDPSFGGILSIFNDPLMLATAGFLAFNFVSALIFNKYQLFQEYPGKVFRAFWGYEKAENDSALFFRKGFIARSLSLISMKLFNNDSQDFEPLLVVVDKAKVNAITQELVKKGLAIDPPKPEDSTEETDDTSNPEPVNSALWEASEFKEVQLKLFRYSQ